MTGHKYRLHWSISGLDWMKMTMERSEHWQEDDRAIIIVNNFADVRAKIDLKTGPLLHEQNDLESLDVNYANHFTG